MGYRPGRVPASVRDRLHDLVETSDRDFVPPLSWRAAIGEVLRKPELCWRRLMSQLLYP